MSNSAKAKPAATRQSPAEAQAITSQWCGLALASEALGDRWVLLIIREAFYGVTRFEQFLADLGAPRAVLSQRLVDLVDKGILQRLPYREAGSRTRHEYKLTTMGEDLGVALMALLEWGDRYIRCSNSPVELVEKATGKPLYVCLATKEGRVVGKNDAELRARPAVAKTKTSGRR